MFLSRIHSQQSPYCRYHFRHNQRREGERRVLFVMATATASSHNYRNISDNPACFKEWKRMEMKAFPESVQPDDLYRSGASDKTAPSDMNSLDSANLSSPKSIEDWKGDESLTSSFSDMSRQLLSTSVSTFTGTPWRTKDYSCDPAGLHDEINDFYEYMKPRPSEVRMRMEVIQRVMNIILYRCPYARIEPFGSFITGLFLPTSDVDLVVFCQPQPSLFSLEEDFKAHDIAVEDTMRVLDRTAVPVIKFTDKMSCVSVDISFNQLTGLLSAEKISGFIRIYPYLPKLVLALKQFLTQRNLQEVFIGGISSYSLILLLVNFLQLHPRQRTTDLSADLGTLLIEFFELYGRKFNYMKTGIRVTNGGSYIPKEEFDIQDFLYIEDPAVTSNDVHEMNAASGCYGMYQVKMEFDQAYTRLSSAVLSRENPVPQRDSILGSIIKISKELDDYRNWSDSNWPTHPLSPPTTVAPIYYPAPLIIPTLTPFHQFPHHIQQQFTPLVVSSELESLHHHNISVTTSPSHSSDHAPSNTTPSSKKS